jgi:hypothetical protein
VPATLVVGGSAGAREAAIGAALDSLPTQDGAAVILEGLAPGNSPLDTPSAGVHVARIAPGCLCCTGNVILRVTLNRLLRKKPARLYLGVARSEHLDQLRSWLQAEPYDQLLRLTPDLDVQHPNSSTGN